MDTLLSQFLNPSFLNSSSFLGIIITVFVIVFALVIILLIVPLCLIFKKAGREWWEALIPFYNIYVLTIITGQPWWVILLFFVPFVNYVVGPYVTYQLSKRFGFGIPFTIGLVFLPFIFYPILAFGNALYIPLDNKETEGSSSSPLATPIAPSPVSSPQEEVKNA